MLGDSGFRAKNEARVQLYGAGPIKINHSNTALNLSFKNINDEDLENIKKYLKQLTHLEILDLGNNRISVIPLDLVKYNMELTYLFLWNNPIPIKSQNIIRSQTRSNINIVF